MSRHFETSHVPELLPEYLPDDWRGAFVLLVMVFVLSSFLDNIAAATDRRHRRGECLSPQAAQSVTSRALVAASNAGGSGSVVGDTTTTMMWIDGVSTARRACTPMWLLVSRSSSAVCLRHCS
jgi:Na+/H+ antiporter NhaD/arsenite permease-like protein